MSTAPLAPPRRRLLLVEDDELLLRSLRNFLGDFEVLSAASAEQALELLSRTSPPALALLDVMLPEMSGMDLLRELRRRLPDVPVIMLTAVDRTAAVVEAVKLGAADYLVKPFQPEELLLAVDRALEERELRSELHHRRQLQLLANRPVRLVGTSAQLEALRTEIDRIGPAQATVLIEGETGTGKELVARGLHAASSRAGEAFVALNCGAIPKDLVESELFGHQRGAFTGAAAGALGKFQLAHKGTLLLDEVGELPLEAQVKLLRVLEEHEFYPVGGSQLVRVDVRVLASTHRNLEEMIAEGRFRQDLYFRLNVLRLHVPPLRERPQDVMDLAEHFLGDFCRRFGKAVFELAPDARQSLESHPFPGNVRELRNLVERLALSADGPVIRREQLDFLPLTPPAADSFTLPRGGVDLDALERQLMLQALERTGGNRARAARLLGLTPPTFYYRLEKHGLKGESEG